MATLVADNIAQLLVYQLNGLFGKHIVPKSIRGQNNNVAVLELMC